MNLHRTCSFILTGKRHSTKPGSKSSEKLRKIVDSLISSVSSTLRAPVCQTTVAIDVRSRLIRTEEVSVLHILFSSSLFRSRPQGTGLQTSFGMPMMMHCLCKEKGVPMLLSSVQGRFAATLFMDQVPFSSLNLCTHLRFRSHARQYNFGRYFGDIALRRPIGCSRSGWRNHMEGSGIFA
jgi:hypothetical protein